MEDKELFEICAIAKTVSDTVKEINPHTKTERLLGLLCNILARTADMETIQTLDFNMEEEDESDESGCFIS